MVALLNNMMLDAVQAVVDTVTAPGLPDIAPDTPQEAFAPVAIESLFPAVPRTRLPLLAVMFPKVAVIPVPAVTVVVAAKEVVVVKEPGAAIAEGREIVATPAAVVTVTWFVVPRTETIAPEPLANSTQFPPPAYI